MAIDTSYAAILLWSRAPLRRPTSAVIAGCALIGFVVCELTAKEPLLNLAVFILLLPWMRRVRVEQTGPRPAAPRPDPVLPAADLDSGRALRTPTVPA